MKIFKFLLKRNSEPKGKDLRVVSARSRFWKPALLLLPAIIVLIAFTIIPFIYTVQDGFHYIDKNDFSLLSTGHFGLESFRKVAIDPFFIQGFKNSIYYALIAVPLILIISVVISSALASVIRRKIRGILQTIFFLPYITSAIAISLAFAFIFNYDTGLLNKIIAKAGGHTIPWLLDQQGNSALISMIIYGVWRGLAFNILIFTTAMLGVDKTLYKAASIDGAGPVRQFFRITLPAINRTTNFLIIMGIIGAIKVFPLALFQNNTKNAMQYGGTTLMLYIYDKVQNGFNNKAGAASVYLLLISVAYTIVIKGGFNQLIKFANWRGEKRVSNKIKAKASYY